MSASPKKILIGTSEDAIFDHFAILLKHHLKARGGAEIVRADRCDESVKLAVADEFDVILIVANTMLPGTGYTEGVLKNSLRILKLIKAANPATLIALTTIWEWSEDLLAAGADASLALPCSIADVTAAVDRGLDIDTIENSNLAPPTEVGGAGTHLRRRSDPLNQAPVRIVLVDDEDWFVDMVKMAILERNQVVLKPFTSGADAWRELEQRTPDMLIVGGIMAGISGREIVTEFMSRNVTYPILVVSGFLEKEHVLSWFPGAPNISFLKKPFSLEAFYAELDKHFEPREGAD